MDKLAGMQAFARVVEAGSFVKAAAHLHISTTAASRLVADLEANLGLRLLQRTTRRLSLTEAGAAYFERCQQILAAIDEAEAVVGHEGRQPFGTLRLSAPVAFGNRHLAPLLAAFGARYPEVKVDVALADRVVDLVDEGFDVAVRIVGHLADTLVARRLTTVRMVICASPEYVRAHGLPRTPADMAAHNCLLYTLTERNNEWTFTGRRGTQTAKVGGGLRSNNGELLRTAALAGEGVVLQPTFMVGEDLQRGTLVRLLPGFELAELAAWAVYPTRRHLPAKVRAFVDFLAETISDPPPWDAWMSKKRV